MSTSASNAFGRTISIGAFLVNLAVIVFAWWHYSITPQHIFSTANILIDIGNISALLASYLILWQLLLMSRLWWLEEQFGFEQLNRVHKKNGKVAFSLLVLHVIFTTIGYELQRGVSFVSQTLDFIHNFNDVFKALLGFILLSVVIATSIQLTRRHLRYEWWYGVHFMAYFAVALAFAHQLSVGTDFVGHTWLIAYWYWLYFVTFFCIVWYRFAWPLLLAWHHRFQVALVRPETADTVSFVLRGRNLASYQYQPGQFAIWHILTPRHFWQAHPFSYTSIPSDPYVRLTAKASGDFTSTLKTIEPGAYVIIDGPHGKLTADKAITSNYVFIAGGVGITPLFSLIRELAPKHRKMVLLYACRTTSDIIFYQELEKLKATHELQIHYFFSNDPSQPARRIDQGAITSLIADAQSRDYFVCGPTPMMDSVSVALKALNVPKDQIHLERFGY